MFVIALTVLTCSIWISSESKELTLLSKPFVQIITSSHSIVHSIHIFAHHPIKHLVKHQQRNLLNTRKLKSTTSILSNPRQCSIFNLERAGSSATCPPNTNFSEQLNRKFSHWKLFKTTNTPIPSYRESPATPSTTTTVTTCCPQLVLLVVEEMLQVEETKKNNYSTIEKLILNS